MQNALREISKVTEKIQKSTRETKRPDRYDRDPKYARLATVAEPRTYKEAMESDAMSEWESAAQTEMETIKANRTWTLVDLPANCKLIGCRWVFKVKYDANGNVDWYKARLVAKGYTQVHEIDYTETFAPVVKFNSIRTLLALAA